jgi:hypothetical protein
LRTGIAFSGKACVVTLWFGTVVGMSEFGLDICYDSLLMELSV